MTVNITSAVLRQIAGSRTGEARLVALAVAMNDLFPQYGINTIDRAAHFLGQTAHESSGFSRLVENLNYSAPRLLQIFGKYFSQREVQDYAGKPQRIANRVYGGRGGNGPESTGDGWRYRGRGIIQLTGKDNYQVDGGSIGVDLVSNPDKAAAPRLAVHLALEFWRRNKLNGPADRNDGDRVTRIINGGYHGKAERRQRTDKARRALGGTGSASPPSTPGVPGILRYGDSGPAVQRLQQNLRRLGYHEAGRPDGHFGARARGAVLAFQADNDLVTDGIAGPATLNAIATASPRVIDEARRTATASDLKKDGSQTVAANRQQQTTGAGLFGLGGLGGYDMFSSVSDKFHQAQSLGDQALPFLDRVAEAVRGHEFQLLVIGGLAIGGAAVWYRSVRANAIRVEQHRTGRTA